MSSSVQWSFGYGLSYTQFKYSNLRVLPKEGDPGFVSVTADVQNTGGREGDEVSQLHVTELTSSVVTPVVEDTAPWDPTFGQVNSDGAANGSGNARWIDISGKSQF
jgi:hypothetical protein